VGFELELSAGADDDIAEGRGYHSLSIWADPADDKFPRFVMTDADLYLEGAPDALDGRTIEVDTEGGDDDAPEDPSAPWIRPGSLVGMAQIIFEPASAEERGDWDPSARKELDGVLKLAFSRSKGDLWRVTVSAESREINDRVHLEFEAPLEIIEL
jgi:hypothetical protein